MMHYLIGIDDTDNLETRGTGHRVRQLANWLVENKLAVPKGITRHQLLVHPQIPYTSHNSSACLSVETKNAEGLWEAAREFLLREGAFGSDVGLCLAEWKVVSEEVRSFGRRAKVEVLTMLDAQQLASRSGIRCEGLMGTGGGVIGATILFAGNLEGITQTMPMAIYLGFERNLGVALALSVVLVIVSVFLLMLTKRLEKQDQD